MVLVCNVVLMSYFGCNHTTADVMGGKRHARSVTRNCSKRSKRLHKKAQTRCRNTLPAEWRTEDENDQFNATDSELNDYLKNASDISASELMECVSQMMQTVNVEQDLSTARLSGHPDSLRPREPSMTFVRGSVRLTECNQEENTESPPTIATPGILGIQQATTLLRALEQQLTRECLRATTNATNSSSKSIGRITLNYGLIAHVAHEVGAVSRRLFDISKGPSYGPPTTANLQGSTVACPLIDRRVLALLAQLLVRAAWCYSAIMPHTTQDSGDDADESEDDFDTKDDADFQENEAQHQFADGTKMYISSCGILSTNPHLQFEFIQSGGTAKSSLTFFAVYSAFKKFMEQQNCKILVFPPMSRSKNKKILNFAKLFRFHTCRRGRNKLRKIIVVKTSSSLTPPKAALEQAELEWKSIGNYQPTHTTSSMAQKRSNDSSVVGSDQAIDEVNIGHKLLCKLGWNPGCGLGRDGSGIKQPVLSHGQKDRRGLGQ
eukprot:gene7271-7665_t